jgi:hypothetical protein
VDLYTNASLRTSFVNVAFREEAAKVLGKLSDVEGLARLFFSTTWTRIPFLSQARFAADLPRLYSQPRAEYLLLCLAVKLAVTRADELAFEDDTMQSTVYVTVKCLIASLEAINHVSLLCVQARALLCYYEVGHGIYPAAMASVAACAATARVLGLERKAFESRERQGGTEVERLTAEEEKRTWWTIINMDR